MKSLVMSKDKWATLKEQFNKDYPPSVNLVREKMKRIVGCTPRFHETWDAKTGYKIEVHLDFYDEQKKTMFFLKYGDWFR